MDSPLPVVRSLQLEHFSIFLREPSIDYDGFFIVAVFQHDDVVGHARSKNMRDWDSLFWAGSVNC
jgi:hypothetical protein